MTRTRYTIADVPASLSWSDLADFATHLPSDSALLSEIDENTRGWGSEIRTQAILADIFDLICLFIWIYAKSHVKKGVQVKQPPQYPRPWVKEDKPRTIGSGAIPADKFDEWWESKNN